MSNLINELIDIKKAMNAGYASLTFEGGNQIVSITINDTDEPSENKEMDNHTDIPVGEEKPSETQEEPAELYERHCNKCGRTFLSKSNKARTCDECKKQAQREATARYEARKKAEQTAEEVIKLGEE